jgi:hypothetical protein
MCIERVREKIGDAPLFVAGFSMGANYIVRNLGLAKHNVRRAHAPGSAAVARTDGERAHLRRRPSSAPTALATRTTLWAPFTGSNTVWSLALARRCVCAVLTTPPDAVFRVGDRVLMGDMKAAVRANYKIIAASDDHDPEELLRVA